VRDPPRAPGIPERGHALSSAPAAVSAGRSKSASRPPAAVARRAVARLTMPVLLLLPAMVIIVGLVGYPLVRTVYLSFTDTGLGELIYGGSTWVGLDNYKEVFADEHLRASLVNTVVFGTVCVIGTMVFGFAVALLLNQRLRGNWFFAIAVLLPWAVPALAASAIFKWLFDSRYGFVNWALVELGFSGFEDYAWFAEQIPSAHLRIGSKIQGHDTAIHRTDYRLNEDAIPLATKLMARGVVEFLD